MMKPMSLEIKLGRDLKENKTKLIEYVKESVEDGATRKESEGFREDQHGKGSTLQGRRWGITKEDKRPKMVKEGETLRKPGGRINLGRE